MEIDSGACRTVIHEKDVLKYFGKVELKPFKMKLYFVSGQAVNILGYFKVKVTDILNPN